MKKARAWLDAHDIAYRFHDYKVDGIERATLDGWIAALGWEVVLNRAGTTFRKLPEGDKTNLNAARAADLMVAQPSMIKRPILAVNGKFLAGFKPELYAAAFAARRKT
jgi:arsenate reductase